MSAGPTYRRIRLSNSAKTSVGPVFGSSSDSECFITSSTPGSDIHIVHPTSQSLRVGASYTTGLSISDAAGAVTVGLGSGGTLTMPAFNAPSLSLSGTDLATRLTTISTAATGAAADASSALSAVTTVTMDLATLVQRVADLEALVQ